MKSVPIRSYSWSVFSCIRTEYTKMRTTNNSVFGHFWRSVYLFLFFMAPFVDGVQLPQVYSHFEEAVYFLPFISQKFLVLILSISEGWKAELALEPPSGFYHGTPGLGIQRLKRHRFVIRCVNSSIV